MNKSELMECLETSGPGDWETFVCAGWGSGPSYLQRLLESDGTSGWRISIEEHSVRAAYKPNLSLGVAYGMQVGEGEPYEADWAKFPDRQVRAYFADVFWTGMLVHRAVVLSVDGGRAILPDPSPWGTTPEGSTMPVIIGQAVSRSDAAFARAIHCLEHQPAEFERYLEQSGMLVEPPDAHPL